ncbi:uncharacterized protein LOC144119179 [Amblyomma americanum]
MFVSESIIVLLMNLLLSESSHPHLDLNPDLGRFQDETQCFPLTDTWHMMYRNFEADPYLGGKTKCLRAMQKRVFENDAVLTTFESSPGVSIDVVVTLMSSPGYTAKNIMNFQPENVPGTSLNVTMPYIDCNLCKVMRHSYISNGAGCSMWVPERSLQVKHQCCDFIFELLCESSSVYQIYDESCQ